MEETRTKLSVFIDYDNLSPLQKASGILDIVSKALLQLPTRGITTRANCDVRIYGGWYEGQNITRLAENVVIEIQRDFPKIIKLKDSKDSTHIQVSTNAELAVALIQEPSHHLFNTYRKKGKPTNLRVAKPIEIGCSNTDCILPAIKKVLSSGKCSIATCSTNNSSLIYRHEQKIVDTMLTCDLVYSANEPTDRIILISGDDDFLPPLRTAALKGIHTIRFHPKPTEQRSLNVNGGAKFLEMVL